MKLASPRRNTFPLMTWKTVIWLGRTPSIIVDPVSQAWPMVISTIAVKSNGKLPHTER